MKTRGVRFINSLATFEKPLLIAVDGKRHRARPHHAAALRFVYVSDRASLVAPFVNLGSCEAASPLLLPRLTNHVRAAESSCSASHRRKQRSRSAW